MKKRANSWDRVRFSGCHGSKCGLNLERALKRGMIREYADAAAKTSPGTPDCQAGRFTCGHRSVVSEEATLGQVAETAGQSQADFLRELGSRRIPIHYGIEELAEDLATLESLPPR
jgi:hypothetical protein